MIPLHGKLFSVSEPHPHTYETRPEFPASVSPELSRLFLSLDLDDVTEAQTLHPPVYGGL